MIEEKTKKEQYLSHITKNIPHKPGVYKMKNAAGEIIYIGKAKDLKNRVSNYFQNGNDKGMRTIKMVEQIANIEYVVVKNELEALMLETILIKENRPKYNILMKDDKNYVYIKITVQEPYPRIYIVRKVAKDKARYFGPKTSAHKVIKTLKVLKRVFPFRHCSLAIDYGVHGENKRSMVMTEANLQYHSKHCIGPCITTVSPEKYREMINRVIAFFEGKHEEIIEKIKEDMHKAAVEKKFEQAALIRDRLIAVEEIIEPQRISDPHQKDLDIVNYFEQDDKIYFNLFQLRSGKLIGQENFIFKATKEHETEDKEALNAFLEQYYEKTMDLPKEVLIPHEIYDPETIESWLSEMKGQKVSLLVPERGKKNQLLELSFANAQSFAKQSEIKWQGETKPDRLQALEELQKVLGLPAIPNRLECYDVSHFAGTETVASMVVFEHGFPNKADYRHFRLHQNVSGAPDDFASMEEALTRRLKYLKPSVNILDLRIRKPKKSEIPFIAKQLKLKKLPSSIFYSIDQRKEMIGFVQIFQTDKKKTLIQKIHANKKIEFTMLIKKIIEKTKVKRIYLVSNKEEVPKYEESGFQRLKKLPDGFKQKNGQSILIYDKNKYTEDKSFKKIPDLMIIDGGKGQLSSAQKALAKYKITLPMVSLAKREEEIFLPNQSIPIVLAKNDPILHMIQHIRDEAHRFAITYHQNLRLKATTYSILDTIAGIGPELRVKLLKHFGSVENIKNASTGDIVAQVGEKLAQKIKEKLKG